MALSKIGSKVLGNCKLTKYGGPNNYIHIPQSKVVKEYNAFISGVDLLGRVIGKYCVRSRKKIRFVYHFFKILLLLLLSWNIMKNNL